MRGLSIVLAHRPLRRHRRDEVVAVSERRTRVAQAPAHHRPRAAHLLTASRHTGESPFSLLRPGCLAREVPICARLEWLSSTLPVTQTTWWVIRASLMNSKHLRPGMAQPSGAASGEPSRLRGVIGRGGQLESDTSRDSTDGGMRAGANCERDQVAQPAWGTRAERPGKRGCWALTKAGRHCAAAVRGDGDFCNAHSGIGVAASPAEHSLVGRARSAEARRTRADLRLVLGHTRMDTPRAALRAVAILNAERLAGTTISAALDPSVPPERRARLALDIVEAVDPKVSTALSITSELDVDNASLGQLIALAEEQGHQPRAPC